MSVTVNKFKLEGRGYQGVKVSGTETRDKDGFMVVVDIDMNFKIPLPTEIFNMVQRLKKYMLDLCGYWHPGFDQFIKQGQLTDMPVEAHLRPVYHHLMQLMDSAEVSGVVRKDSFFILTGKLTNIIGGTVGLSTPLTGPSSGYDRWDQLSRGCYECLTQVQNFVNERRLRMMSARQYALFDEKDPEKIDQYESMTDEQLIEVQIKNLESRGCIVMMPSDYATPDKKDLITERIISERPVGDIGEQADVVIEVATEPLQDEAAEPPAADVSAVDDLPDNF